MWSQQKKIEEQRAVIEHLKQKIEKEGISAEISQLTANLKVPCIHKINTKKEETVAVTHVSDNHSTKEDINDTVNHSDSAINTDSGSDSTVIDAKHKLFRNPDEIMLSRSLSDLHLCKHMREQYLRKRQSHAVYPNHRSVQRPRDVKKRHWRKSALGIDLEETFFLKQ